MKIGLIVLAVLVVVALMLGSSFISSRNQMAVKREAVNAAWAQVDVVLQRRGELVPQFVGEGKGVGGRGETPVGDIARAPSPPLCAAFPACKNSARGEHG